MIDPEDESRQWLDTFLALVFAELKKEALRGDLEFVCPLEVAEALEPLGERSWTCIREALAAQATDRLLCDVIDYLEQGDSFAWPLADPQRCLAIIVFGKYTRKVRGEDDPEPADWWKEEE